MFHKFLLTLILLESTLCLHTQKPPTTIQCYRCMDSIYSQLHKPCKDKEPTFQTCHFSSWEILNWPDVQDYTAYDVNLSCILLAYKYDLQTPNMTVDMGCIATYNDYNVCTSIYKILNYTVQMECKVCSENLCNYLFKDDISKNGSVRILLSPKIIFLLFIITLLHDLIKKPENIYHPLTVFKNVRLTQNWARR